MTEEIKEILDKLRYIVDFPIIEHDTSFNSDNAEESVCLLISNECQLLLDYITNLQQENEKLRFDISYWEDKWQNTRFANNQVKVLQDTIIKSANNTNRAIEQTEIYKSRCKKAIEYIYHWSSQRKFFFDKIDRQLRGKPEFKGDIADLLNILNGSDDE